MRASRQKSRTFRRVKKRIPGGKTVTHYVLRKPSRSHCADCGSILASVSHGRKLAKTAKRPERPFGGVLCSACSRIRIVLRARQVGI